MSRVAFSLRFPLILILALSASAALFAQEKSEPPSLADGGPKKMTIDHDPKLADAAWDYLDALILEDYDRAATYLDGKSRYQDFSIELFGREIVDLTGDRKILDYWKESASVSGTVEVRFNADQHFVAGPNVYFIGTAFVKNLGEAWGVAEEYLDFTFTQISHVRIVDGKVTYHADHVDYVAAYEQLQKHMENAGPIDTGARNSSKKQ